MEMFEIEINYAGVCYKGKLLSIVYNDMNENLSNTHTKHYDVVLLNKDNAEIKCTFLSKEFIKII